MSTARPPEIPAVANQHVLVELLRTLPRPWNATVISPSELLAIAYAPRSQWPQALGLKVDQLLEAHAGERPPRRSQSLPRVVEWSANDTADHLPPASRPEGAQRRHCLTLVLEAFKDREEAEKWPGYIRALLDECAMPEADKELEVEGDPGDADAVAEDPAARDASPARQSALDLLDTVEEALCYILECLVEDLTGEAKRELHQLVVVVEAAQGLDAAGQAELFRPLRESLAQLRGDNYDATARARLVTLRRRLHMTRRALQAKPSTYSAMSPLNLWAIEA
jgi:hypothetical protein